MDDSGSLTDCVSGIRSGVDLTWQQDPFDSWKMTVYRPEPRLSGARICYAAVTITITKYRERVGSVLLGQSLDNRAIQLVVCDPPKTF